ncbi:MAG: glycosyltransferase [Bacteroidetes bacterium]|nr:glycosyltransferase [Bacteroidota bacterium]
MTSVSIIIPTYNEEKLIEQTLNQFSDDFKRKFGAEVIVSDGGSSDSTLSRLNGAVDKIVKHDKSYKQNISDGRNKGFEVSTGDVLIFLNADTLIMNPDGFMEQVMNVMKNDDCLAVACRVKVFPEDEKLSDKLFHFCYNNYVRFLNFAVMGMGRGECHIIRRDAFEKSKGYNTEFSAGEDFDLYKRINKLGKILYRGDMVVYESPRRYRKYGYARVFYDWAKNSIWITLFKKSLSKEWEAVR